MSTKVRVEIRDGKNKDKTPHVVRVYFEHEECSGTLCSLGDTYCRHCGDELTKFKEDIRE